MERISALMDGELDAGETGRVLDGMKDHPELGHAWATYHAIGDAMRNARWSHANISGRVAARLATEPTVIAPRRARCGSGSRFGLPALAAAAAVASVTWMVSGTQAPTAAPAPIAQSAPVQPISIPAPAITPAVAVSPIVTSLDPPVHLDRAALTQYIMAHQEYSPSTLMQGVASYMRTMASETSGLDK